MLTECWVNVNNVCDLSSWFVCVVSHSGMCECICVRWFLTVLVHVCMCSSDASADFLIFFFVFVFICFQFG